MFCFSLKGGIFFVGEIETISYGLKYEVVTRQFSFHSITLVKQWRPPYLEFRSAMEFVA